MTGPATARGAAIVAPEPSWVLEACGIPALREAGLTGAGVLVGHVDSGVAPGVRGLDDRVGPSCDATADGVVEGVPGDDTGHGTRTASLIAAGVVGRVEVGVAPGARLAVARVIEGGAAVVRIVRGLQWVLDQGAGVVLLTAGFPTLNPVLRPILQHARSRGVLVVCPVGNAGAGRALQPGDDPSVLSVGALTREGRRARFSGTWRHGSGALLAPDLSAPGDMVLAAHPEGGTVRASGTSMAAAVVTGVCAAMLEAEPRASADDLVRALVAGEVGAALDARAGLERLTPGGAVLPASRPARLAGRWRDTRLRYQVAHSAADDWLTSVVVPSASEERWDVLDAALARAGASRVARVERVPAARAAFVTARADVHAALLDDTELQWVSAADSGRLLERWWRPRIPVAPALPSEGS